MQKDATKKLIIILYANITALYLNAEYSGKSGKFSNVNLKETVHPKNFKQSVSRPIDFHGIFIIFLYIFFVCIM